MVATKWGRISDSQLLKLHLENSTGFLVGEIASLDYNLSVFVGSVASCQPDNSEGELAYNTNS